MEIGLGVAVVALSSWTYCNGIAKKEKRKSFSYDDREIRPEGRREEKGRKLPQRFKSKPIETGGEREGERI